MAKKTIRVTNVTKSPAKKQVVISTGNMLYLVSEKVLAAQGVLNPFDLRGKTLGIETFEPGEQLLNGQVYEQREDTTLIKAITAVPGYEQMSQQEVMFQAMRSGFADYMKAAGFGAAPAAAPAPEPVATPARIAAEVVDGDVAENAAPAAPAEAAPAEAANPAENAEVVNNEVMDEALPE